MIATTVIVAKMYSEIILVSTILERDSEILKASEPINFGIVLSASKYEIKNTNPIATTPTSELFAFLGFNTKYIIGNKTDETAANPKNKYAIPKKTPSSIAPKIYVANITTDKIISPYNKNDVILDRLIIIIFYCS